jgi:hypothetical protein
MLDTVSRYLANIHDGLVRRHVTAIVRPLADRYSSQCLNSAGLVIKAGGGVLVKGGSAFYAIANGTPVTKAVNTDMAALVGTVTAATFNVFAFDIDAAGTLTTSMGTAGATLAAVKFPPLTEKKARIGYLVINPTGTGDFVGGTTALDDATVVPNAAYINTPGCHDQTVILD